MDWEESTVSAYCLSAVAASQNESDSSVFSSLANCVPAGAVGVNIRVLAIRANSYFARKALRHARPIFMRCLRCMEGPGADAKRGGLGTKADVGD